MIMFALFSIAKLSYKVKKEESQILRFFTSDIWDRLKEKHF